MNLKTSLIVLTLVSVVADTMLLPFYPDFFASTFSSHSAFHVGAYIAACCFTVMVAFPVWAKVARKVNELHLWVYTQIASGVFGVWCFLSTSLVEFWIVSQVMLVFKASYLLIYPFVMRLEKKEKHLGVAGLFSVLMHFGGIAGALMGGIVLQFYNPQDIYLIMVASDAVQVLMCISIILYRKVPFRQVTSSENKASTEAHTSSSRWIILKLGVVSMVFYFSAFLIRPYFARYWEMISHQDSDVLAALAYSIPAWVALICLWLERNRRRDASNVTMIVNVSLLLVLGVLVQSIDNVWCLVLGRCLFGYAMFQVTVRLEVLMFSLSRPERYAEDFSMIHFFQNVGVIVASFGVGFLVDSFNLFVPFYVSALGGVVAVLFFYYFFFGQERYVDSSSEKEMLAK